MHTYYVLRNSANVAFQYGRHIYLFTSYLLFNAWKKDFTAHPLCYTNSLLSSIKKFQIMQRPRLTTNFIQFLPPAAHDHYKQTILRIGKIHCTGVCTLNKIHSSQAEDGTRKSWHYVKRTSLKHSLKKENMDD